MRIPVGRRIYIHSSSPAAKNLLISAHGTGRGCGMFTVPNGVTLNFYSTHGTYLVNAFIGPALDGAHGVAESVGGGCTSHDYYLWKFQGARHGGNDETYVHLANHLSRDRANRFDVLTIRNRLYPRKPTRFLLSAVLENLSRCGRDYPMIYCLFCRSLRGRKYECPQPFGSERVS